MNDFEQLPNNCESESSGRWSVIQETLDTLNIWSVLWEDWGRSLTQTMKDEWKKKETIYRRKPEAVRKLPITVNFLLDTCSIIALPCLAMPTWLFFSPPEDMDDVPIALQFGLPGSFVPLATFVDYDKGRDDMLSNKMILACSQHLTALIAWLFRHLSFSNNVQLDLNITKYY